MATKTELEWTYEPGDFFESAFVAPLPSGQLLAEHGKATVTLSTAADPVPVAILESIQSALLAFFEAREVITHRAVGSVVGPSIIQHGPGGRGVVVRLVGASTTASAGRLDVIVTSADGKVITDTKAERIAGETAFVMALAPKLLLSPVLRAMIGSYVNAVRDPKNELIHLYEIRDAIAGYYGNETAARAALRIPKANWKAFGQLANDEPIRQGRHRGRQPTALRDATQEELATARAIARRMIELFAATI